MIEFSAFKKDLDKKKPEASIQETPSTVNEDAGQHYQEALQSLQESVVESSAYKIYRDKAETFVCDMEISGANPHNSKARIIIESKDLTYMFEGTIDEKGQCRIPLRKMNFLQENESGIIKLEVIAEDMVFTPWQNNFLATNYRKVSVKLAESVETTPKVGITVSNIR